MQYMHPENKTYTVTDRNINKFDRAKVFIKSAADVTANFGVFGVFPDI